MAKSTLEAGIRNRIEALAAELTGLVRQEAIASIQAALGGNGTARGRRGPGRRRRPGRPKGSARRKAGARRGPGRPPNAATEALVPKVLAQVKAKDGQGVSDIAKALRVNVDRVKPVMVKLLAARQVKKSGQKRGTKYHVAGGGKNGAATAKPAARKKSGRRRVRKSGRRQATARNK